ncbi:hypothetical protein P7K49_009221 [Saguinus oedipus]|uniref:Uncharacterized protein n=1 Tax=Saguinus oedipus TaxID=9490 RepID=A0ABQ9VJC5_SAGOE|nr:hypothetical protein P7K49_009221 [Saguinus oedipus]
MAKLYLAPGCWICGLAETAEAGTAGSDGCKRDHKSWHQKQESNLTSLSGAFHETIFWETEQNLSQASQMLVIHPQSKGL